MRRHLSEDTLIQYIFDLTEDKAQIAEHLAECTDCTAAYEKLKAKFASLDTLNEEIKADDALLAKTISNAKAPRKPVSTRFIPPRWLIAVAAVLMIGTLVVTIFHDNTPEKIGLDLSGGTSLEYSLEKESNVRKSIIAESDAKSNWAFGLAKKSADERFNFAEPPFPPASAIELNVLPKKQSSQITIYNSADLTLVRETRKLTLKRGWNWLQFMWANTLIDPTSLSLEPVEHKKDVRIEQLVFPPRLKDIGRWLIASEVEGEVEFELTYFTSGINWRAFYMGTLTPDEKQMKLQGYVRVANNSGEDYENTQTRLIVGKVNLLDKIAQLAKRQHPYNSPVPISRANKDWYGLDSDDDGVTDERVIQESGSMPILGDMPLINALFKEKEVKKQGLSEYFLYTIEGTENIKNKWGKRLPSFTADEIDVVSLYKYDEALYGGNVIRFVSFKNDEEHNLGETPIPNGNIKIYTDTGSNGNLSFTGSSNMKYIPVNEKVELNLSNARGVIVEPKVMDTKTINYSYDKNGNINGYDKLTTYKLDIRNTRKLNVKVEIKRHFNTKAWQIESSNEYEKIDADTIKYTLNLKPESKTAIEYTLTTHHGENESVFFKNSKN